MNWVAITEANVQEKMATAEWTRIGAKFSEAVITVTNLVRGYVASAAVDMDSDTTKIPDRLVGPACDLLVVELYTANGGVLVDPKETRREARRAALRLLERVADGKYSIADPDSGAESAAAEGGATVVNSRTARVTRDNMRGL